MSSAGLAAAAVALAVAPVAADTELGHKGTVGQHSLRDTSSKGGVKCVFRTLSESNIHWEGGLARIDVRPPKMKAVSGRQTVGWRFIVQRSKDHGPWKVTYRSPIQKAKATTTTLASFSKMSIKVNVPAASRHENRHFYRVNVKMFWYRSNGTVQGTARHRVDWYQDVIKGLTYWPEPGGCAAWSAWVV
jgi:hypothetical protein